MKTAPFLIASLGALFSAATLFGAPTISTHPKDNTAVPGQTLGFGVKATGTGTLTYQWYRDGALLAGATGDHCFVPSVAAADHGATFSVVVGDDSGVPTVSTAATLLISTYTAREEPAAPDPTTARYHLDPVSGDDTTGTGAADRPFRSLAKVVPLLRGGELVLLHAGTYDALNLDAALGTIKTLFTDWVTFMAAPGAAPVLETVYLHGKWNSLRQDWNGNFDLRVRLIGLTVANALSVLDVNYVRVEGCRVRIPGPWSGSRPILDRTAVAVRGARSITFQDCDITETGIGLNCRGNDLVLRRNHIHDIAHDAIRISGCDTVLIEGNHIHNVDDGVEDDVAWSMHADGFQAYNEGGTQPCDRNVNITFRANRLHHTEAMGLMVSDSPTSGIANWVVENNVFGPTGGFMLHLKVACQGFVFRHNSIVENVNDSFQSRYRVVPCNGYDIALPAYASSSNVEIYNNIFRGETRDWGWPKAIDTARFDRNLYYHVGVQVDHGTNPIVIATNPFANPTAFDGALVPDCPALDAASPLGATATDLRGLARDSRPDIGAWEYVPAVGYTGWIAAAGVFGPEAAPGADADGDGLANLLEYALGTAPTQPTAAPAATSAGPDQLALTHRRLKTAAVVRSYDTSTDLRTWTPITLVPEVLVADADGDGQVEIVRVMLPLAPGEPRRFLRLTVRQP